MSALGSLRPVVVAPVAAAARRVRRDPSTGTSMVTRQQRRRNPRRGPSSSSSSSSSSSRSSSRSSSSSSADSDGQDDVAAGNEADIEEAQAPEPPVVNNEVPAANDAAAEAPLPEMMPSMQLLRRTMQRYRLQLQAEVRLKRRHIDTSNSLISHVISHVISHLISHVISHAISHFISHVQSDEPNVVQVPNVS